MWRRKQGNADLAARGEPAGPIRWYGVSTDSWASSIHGVDRLVRANAICDKLVGLRGRVACWIPRSITVWISCMHATR